MPNPPPRLSSSRVSPVASRTASEQAHDPVRGDLEAGRVEDLRADVAVQPGQRAGAGSATTRRGGLERVAGGQREAELLVLVRGRDELVGVRLDAHGRPDQHRHGRAPAGHAAARQGHQPVDLVEGVDDDVPDAARRRRAAARPATCCCRAARSARPGSPRPARGPARCRCTRRGAGRPRRSSGPPGRRGTPWTRSGRRRRRRRSRSRRPGRGSRPRRGRTAGCRASRARSVTGRPPRCRTPSTRSAERGQTCGSSAPRSAGGAPAAVGGAMLPCSGPAGCALTSAPGPARRAPRGRCAARSRSPSTATAARW